MKKTNKTEGRTKGKWARIAVIAVLLAATYCFGVGIRWRIVSRLDSYYGGMLFVRESAFYSSFARELAKDGGLSKSGLQTKAQYPGGFDAEGELTSAKGKLTAYCYRHLGFGNISFEEFARRFDPVFFCLGIVPFFFILRLLSRNDWIALVGSAIYMVTIPALQRSTGAGFNMETFSIPLLLTHLCLFLYGVEKNKAWLSLLSGLALAVSAAGWDFCQFYLIILSSFVFLSIFFLQDWEKLLRHFSLVIPCLILAGVTNIYLRNHSFLTSYGMLLAYPIGICGIIFFFKRIKRLYIVPGIVVVFCILAIFTYVVFNYSRVYSHVTQKFYSKIKHLNSKPVDPKELTFTERIEWTPPFHSATSKFFGTYPYIQILRYAVPAVIPLVFLIVGFFRKKRESADALILYNIVIFVVLYLMFVRLKILLVIFLILLLGIGWKQFSVWSGKRRLVMGIIWGALLGGLLIFETAIAVPVDRNLHMFTPVGRSRMAALKGLSDAIKKCTDEDSVVLADYNISPMILSYADRAIILHPKFESTEMRKRVKEYYDALFSESELELSRFCNKYGADYFVFTYYVWKTERNDPGWIYSPKYMANATETGFKPYSFRWMVADDSRVQYFRPVPDWTVHAPDEKTMEYIIRYKIYEVVTDKEQDEARAHLDRGNLYLEIEEYDNAKKELLAGITLFPGISAEAYTNLGIAYKKTGDDEMAEKYFMMGATFTKEGRQ